jgi:hypothetical protein
MEGYSVSGYTWINKQQPDSSDLQGAAGGHVSLIIPNFEHSAVVRGAAAEVIGAPPRQSEIAC